MSYLYLFNTGINCLIDKLEEAADSSNEVKAFLFQRLLYTGDTALLAHFNELLLLMIELVEVIFI